MDTNLKDDIKDDREKGDGEKFGLKLISTTWGTLLMILVLAVVSVVSYAPIKYNMFGNVVGAIISRVVEQEMILILTIGGISIVLLTILAFAIPYSFQKQAVIVKVYNGIYFEFKLFIWFIFCMVCLLFFTFIMTTGIDVAGLNYVQIIHNVNWHFYAIGIPITFKFYTLIYLTLVYCKHIYYTGLANEIVDRTLIGRLYVYINNYIKKAIDQIIDVEITKEHKKRLLSLVVINFFALLVIALTGGFGVLLAMAYTVVLFNYTLEILDKVRALNAASSQLAKGDFNITLSEDMGILSSFAKSLNNIKEGFRVAVEQEVKSQNMKTELISNVSHDLKTPLTSIITYVDLLKNEDLDRETQKEYIDILDKKSKRLKVLIEDLFEASKASSGNIELDMESLDVIALLRQTLGEMEEKINQSTLKMRVNLPEHKVICSLDGARTYRVFENVISNILKYSMPNSRVYIDAEEYDKSINLIFKNISSYEMNFDPSEITERFTRGDKSRSTEGSGLGLAIAKSLVELQGGNLNINIDGDLFKLTVTFPKA